MPVSIVPSANVLVSGGGFVLNPNPTQPLFQDMVRIAPNPILYETIDPGLTITVQATGGCPPDKIPELITSITLVPGQGASGNTGIRNKIIKLVDIADKDVKDIPAFSAGDWIEPKMAYGSIASAPVPTLALPSPLIGYYGEKYFYDAEYIYASYYANTPDLKGSFYDIIEEEGIVPPINRLTAISLLEGRKFLELNKIPEDTEQISTDMFPPPIIP